MAITPPLPNYHPLQVTNPVKYRHQATGTMLVKLLAGDVYITGLAESITTVLGSCVAVCLRNRRTSIGGMNHFMLPPHKRNDAASVADVLRYGGRYGDTAIDALVEGVLDSGGVVSDLEAKVFGGASVIKLSNDIGHENATFAFLHLRKLGVAVAAQDVGLDYPRKIVYDPKNGRVKMQRLQSAYVGLVAERERSSLDALIQDSRSKEAS